MREGWRKLLTRCDDAITPKPSLGNVLTICRLDPAIADPLLFNEHGGLAGWAHPGPPWERTRGRALRYPRPIDDRDVVFAAHWLESEFGQIWTTEKIGQALHTAAETDDNKIDPVKDYLRSIEWDGLERCESWLADFMGAQNGILNREIGKLWLISAVARVCRPGCKVDHVLVLEGEQGSGKSTALGVLGGEWFSDQMPEIGTKDSSLALAGVWILELAEMDNFRAQQNSKNKRWISQQVERFRPPYGKHTIERPRRCVFAGSTNESTYLSDQTGGRRYWPVECGDVDLAGLAGARDQLWAEAVARFDRGEKWYLEGAELAALAKSAQAERTTIDPWVHAAQHWANNRPHATAEELLDELQIPTHQQTKGHVMRAATVLQALGLTERRQLEVNGVRRRVWCRLERQRSFSSTQPAQPLHNLPIQ